MLQTIFSAKPESHGLSQQLGLALAKRIPETHSPVMRIAVGQTLLHSGVAITRLPLLLSGRIDCVVHLNKGETGDIIPVSFEAGEVVLLSQLFCNIPVWVDLVAAENCTVRWLDVKHLEVLIETDPALLLLLTRFLSQRLREVQTRERGWIERSVHNRVCAHLTRLAQKSQIDAQGHTWIAATHEELAARCGVSRPKLSQELKRLEQAGCIRLSRGKIEILRLAGVLEM